ncbi:HK97 family phage prohead protease [Candidatus Sneabacter namystus]|uniref:HK97 family phage prohead protease n=1 Tax=Candidatus Sneabacter namystus TaxID=2601646 RepID=A0A5C0UHT1_9RICK|nr:HK97 family phage prohead protease [Candidatus Sneabacter namystus]QEK39745.1 HK97 family phage prohead protease [Candidatus Sneabacter namystus]
MYIKGYASVFQHVDQAQDMLMPGAFKKSLQKKNDNTFKLLWQHDATKPIGKIISAQEDTHGLLITASIVKETDTGKEAITLITSGIVQGLSVGIIPNPEKTFFNPQGFNEIYETELHEISVVTFPANTMAKIEDISSQNEINSLTNLINTAQELTSLL